MEREREDVSRGECSRASHFRNYGNRDPGDLLGIRSGRRHGDDSRHTCIDPVTESSTAYCDYLDKEMTIMGLLSAFSIVVPAAVLDRVAGAKLDDHTLVADIWPLDTATKAPVERPRRRDVK